MPLPDFLLTHPEYMQLCREAMLAAGLAEAAVAEAISQFSPLGTSDAIFYLRCRGLGATLALAERFAQVRAVPQIGGSRAWHPRQVEDFAAQLAEAGRFTRSAEMRRDAGQTGQDALQGAGLLALIQDRVGEMRLERHAAAEAN